MFLDPISSQRAALYKFGPQKILLLTRTRSERLSLQKINAMYSPLL